MQDWVKFLFSENFWLYTVFEHVYLIFCGLASFFRMLQQVHTQPIVTTINNIISRPTIAPMAGNARFRGIVCLVAALSNFNGQGDEHMLVHTVFGE